MKPAKGSALDIALPGSQALGWRQYLFGALRAPVFVPAILISLPVVFHAATPWPETEASRPGSARESLIDRFLHSDQPPLTSYRARRKLEASTMGGRLAASLEAWTYVDSSGKFAFEVIREEGSGLIQEHVLLKALQTEQQSHNERGADNAQLSPANYDFEVRADTGETATIGLLPRRQSPMLLNGTVTVTRRDADILRIDGRLSQNPSWWTRRVDIVRRYTRINGVRVPVEMSSRADVRVAGDATFLMTYVYTMINGRRAM